MPRRNVVVTGGAGVIGSRLCEVLIADGAHVLCIDDLSTGKRGNLAALFGHPRFELAVHDVTESMHADSDLRLTLYTRSDRADEIYNLACPASPKHYQADPLRTIETCVMGAVNALQLARHTGAKILQASTSEVYGDPLQHPQHESNWGNVNPVGPRSCYDEGKRLAETLCYEYRQQYGVDTKIARIFNTYGPRMTEGDGRVVSSFIPQALRGDPLTVFGDGSQTRSFCYVDDTVDGLIRLMAADSTVAGPFNIGNPSERSILELAETILTMSGSSSPIEHRPLPTDDPVRRCPDISLARDVLGWEPTTRLLDGLDATIEWFNGP